MRQLPETVTLLLVGRSTPSLPLAEWVAQGRAVSFGADDLKFSASETIALAQKHGAEMNEREATELTLQLEGWPAGIALLVAARARSPSPGEASRIPHATDLIAYHLTTLPSELVEFLERTAPLELLEASLLEQHGGLPAARHTLRELERRGEMLSALPPGGSYRLHPLLREAMLDAVRDREGEQGIARMHGWAGEMFEAAHRHAQALFHHERARDSARLVKFLADHIDALFADGHGEQASRAVHQLAKEGLDIPILVSRIQGMLLRQRGLPGARELFLTALEMAKQRNDNESIFAVRVQLLWGSVETVDPAVAAEVATFAQETAALSALHKAHALILLGWTKVLRSDPDFVPALESAIAAAELGAGSPELRFRAALLNAYAQTGIGDFSRADAMMSELLRDLEPSEHIVLLCWALFWYARFSLVWGDANAAADYARQGTLLGLHLNLHAELASLYSVITEIESAKGDRESCAKAAELLREHIPITFYGPDRFRLGAHAAQMLARCEFLNGAPAEALRLVEAAFGDAPPGSAARFALRSDAALYLSVTGTPGAAAALATASDEAQTVAPFDLVDVAKFASAVALLELLRASSPSDQGPAPRTARPLSTYRSFVASRRDLGDLQRSAELLNQLLTDGGVQAEEDVAELMAVQERLAALGFRFEAAALAALVQALAHQRPAVEAAVRSQRPSRAEAQERKRSAQAPRGAALTKREVEVLVLLEMGLTNREIAQRLNVGTRTVDSHVEHVLSKFNAASRTRAVAEAIRAGVLPTAPSGDAAKAASA